MKKVLVVLATLTVIFPVMSYAQKTRTASGEYTYYAASNESPDQARAIALERAKNQIIADNFGTVVGISNSTVVNNENGKSDVKFLSFGESEVKGEWIETLGEPHFDEDIKNGMIVVKVKVTGVIREIKYAKTQFESKILRNGTDDSFESEKFNNEDFFYLSFKSPQSGYLAVFLYDGNVVSRLLPLEKSGQGSIEVKGGKKYIFFQKDEGRSNYYLRCDDQEEINRFCIVFSPNKFSRPLDSEMDTNVNLSSPSVLSYEDFNRWLARCRKQDVEMSVQYKDITISK